MEPKKPRTIIYIDGFNLYYGALKGTKFKWLDLQTLFQKLLGDHHTITEIKYFTARVSARDSDPDAPNRQDAYLKALEAHIPTVSIYYGHFEEESSSSVALELLQNIKDIFIKKNAQRLWTFELLKELYDLPESPWVHYNRGKPLTDRQLANKLNGFKIASKDIRCGETIRKGYELSDFVDAFQRYLTPITDTHSTNATLLQTNNDVDSSMLYQSNSEEMLRIENTIKSSSFNNCSGVAAKTSI